MRRAFYTLITGFVVGGCLQPTAPFSRSPTTRPAGRSAIEAAQGAPQRHHLKTSVSVTPRAIPTGSGASIVVSLTNLGKEPDTLSFPTGCQLLFRVYNSDHQSVGPVFVCTFSPTTLRLAAGEVVQTTYEWGVPPLPPGRYQVFADAQVLPLSPPFTVRLLPVRPTETPLR